MRINPGSILIMIGSGAAVVLHGINGEFFTAFWAGIAFIMGVASVVDESKIAELTAEITELHKHND